MAQSSAASWPAATSTSRPSRPVARSLPSFSGNWPAVNSEVAALHEGHIVGGRRGRHRQGDAELGSAGFRLCRSLSFPMSCGWKSVAARETAIFASLPPRLFLELTSSAVRADRATGASSCAHRALPFSPWSLSLALGAVPAFAGAPLVPHRAVYDLSLDKASDRSGITGLSGRMVYEFNGSPCEGYTVKFRFVTQIDDRRERAHDRPADDDLRGCRRQDLQLRHQVLHRPASRPGGQGHGHARGERRQGRDRQAGEGHARTCRNAISRRSTWSS